MLDPAPEPPSFPLSPPGDSEVRPVRRQTLPVERLGALIEVFLCSGFPTQLLVFAALSQAGLQACLLYTSDAAGRDACLGPTGRTIDRSGSDFPIARAVAFPLECSGARPGT